METEATETGRVLLDVVIPAREYRGVRLQRGETLRVIDLEGQQVVDLMAFMAADPSEKLSAAYSNALNRTWRLTAGHVLVTNRCRPILRIGADMCGLHYSGGGTCSDDANAARYGRRGTRNCRDNLIAALAPFGLTPRDLDDGCCFNLFMHVAYEPDGLWEIRLPVSRPGDYVDLRAEMDCLVGLSNCPQEDNPCNGYRPTPTRVVIVAAPSSGGAP